MRRVRELEERAGTRFKLVRGLATLCERRSAFEMTARVDPVKARRAAWEAARGGATTPEKRRAALEAAGAALGVPAEEVESALEADFDENLALVRFEAPEPRELVRAYNVALAQTMLFDAVSLEIEVSRNFRSVFQAVKREGLMHVAEATTSGGYRLTLDGPASLLKQTRRYGSAMAKVVPSLRAAAPWKLRATIVERAHPTDATRERTFEASSHALPFPAREYEDAEAEPGFDSRVESRFAEAFRGLRNGWSIEREPALLAAGSSVLIPDFGFSFRGSAEKVYLEIVGYWTPGYLARKLAKVRAAGREHDLLLAVDRSLGCAAEALADLPATVILYDGDVPLAPVARALAERARRAVDEAAQRVAAAGIPAQEVVTLAEIAASHGVGVEAVEAALAGGLDLAGRERVGNALVAPRVIAELASEIEDGSPLAVVEAACAARGLADASSVLARIGGRVVWRGLDASTAVVRR